MSDTNSLEIFNSKMTTICNSIRSKTGGNDPLDLDSMAAAVDSIECGVVLPELTNEGSASDLLASKQLIDGEGNIITGTFSIDSELTTQDNLISQIQSVVNSLPEAGSSEPNLQSKTVTPSTSSQTIKPDSGYDGLSQVTVNAMTTATQATPSISVNSSGLITASATQTAGYVVAGTKSATKQLTTKSATTYTPSTSNQTIAAGTYCSGTQTIKGDANLVADNIKSGTSIFGVTGTYEGSGGGGGGSVETCTVSFTEGSPILDAPIIYYTDSNMTVQRVSMSMGSLTVPVGTIIAINDCTSMDSIEGNGELIFYAMSTAAYKINGSCRITLEGK